MMKLLLGLSLFVIVSYSAILVSPLININRFTDQVNLALVSGLVAWTVYWLIITFKYGW